MPKLNQYITEKAVKEIENLLNTQLNGIGNMKETNGGSQKKAFIKWFLTTYPEYNVAYNPKKRNEQKLIETKGITVKKSFFVKPARIARERDLLFGTNSTEIKNIDGMVEAAQQLHEEVNRKMPPKNYRPPHKSAKQRSESAFGSAQHGSQNAEVQFHQVAGIDYSYFVAYNLLKKPFDTLVEEARQTSVMAGMNEYCKKYEKYTHSNSNFPPRVNDVISSPTEKPVDNSDQTDSNPNSDTDITTPDTSEDEKELNKDKVNASVKKDAKAAEEDMKEKLATSLKQAQSENATDEVRIDAISEAVKVFGNQNCQTEQEQVEIVKKALFQNNPELYRQTMVKELEKVMLKNEEIKEQSQVDEVVKQINIQIIQQGTAKKIAYFKKKVQEVIKSGDKQQIWNLYQEVLLEREKMKVNTYQKDSYEKSQALISELERGISEQPTTTDPVNSFLLPTLLAVGTIILLVVGLLLIKLWEARKKKNKSSKGSY
ncbi:758_t:CDS:2 [Funneliformis geosporum]|uniref:758_t:CDS:1 n=1 Tax=Funneliformis geosporum TaxID=1117311 RepID=A0A9W4SZI4_9GLOM|nr:758_t:CDS:2 [Funneliformis geosporum]